MAGLIKLYKAGNHIIVEHKDNQLSIGTTGDQDVVIDRVTRQYNMTTQHLTARAPAGSSDEVEIVTASGEFVIGPIRTNFLRKADDSTWGANQTAVINALNGSTMFGADLLETRVSANTSGRTTNATNISTLQSEMDDVEDDIENIAKAIKFNANDRGIFLDDNKNLTSSFARLQQNTVKVQVGGSGNTHVTSTESSPGQHSFFVQAGSTGSEASHEALRITGDSTYNDRATISLSGGTTLSFAQGSSVSNFAASFVTSGTFSTARIPTLGASKIGSGTFANARISSGSVTQHAGDIDLEDLGNVHTATPTDGQVLTWDNVNSYWKPADAGGLAMHAGASDILRIASGQLGVSTNLTTTIGEDRLLFYDHSAGKLTALRAGTNLTISGTTMSATDTNTNIGSDNLSISGTRTLTLSSSGNSFAIKAGSTLTPFKVTSNGTSPATIAVNGDLRLDSGALSGGLIKLEENPMGGSNFVALQAPSSLSANLTLKLPATDGTNGQFLQTDGSGNLSFADASGGGSSTKFKQVYPQNFMDDIATTKHYLPFKDINEQTTVYQEEAAMIMPYDGKIVSVSIRLSTITGNGNFTVGIHTRETGVSQFTAANWTEEETETMAFTSTDDYHTFHFVFDNAQHFEAGDLCSISLQASSDPAAFSYWYVSTVIEYDTASDLGSSSTEHGSNP